MHVTIVDGDLPYPATSGKRLRTLNLMLPLAGRHKITYIGRCSIAHELGPAESFLREHGIHPILVHDPISAKSGPAFYSRLAANLASPLPYAAAIHASSAMQQAVQDHARTGAIDLMQVEWLGYMYCHAALTCPVVLQAHNVESLIWQRYAETPGNPIKRTYTAIQHRKFLRYEREQYHGADRVIAVSDADADLARRLYGDPPVSVVDNGVDVAAFRDLSPDASTRQVLFLGALDWRPNIDAAEQLLALLPRLRQRVPGATLAVVGRKPSPALRKAIEATEGARLHADVPDVRPYLRQSTVMAVPLRIGGGSRLKILESLAAGLPVVSTTIGAEGLRLADGEDISLADTDDAFIAALAAALRDPERAFLQAEHGRRTVAASYDWSMLAARLEHVWEDAVRSRHGRLTAHTAS